MGLIFDGSIQSLSPNPQSLNPRMRGFRPYLIVIPNRVSREDGNLSAENWD